MPTSQLPTSQLPIDAHLPEIHAALATHPAVIVEAPPGTGKTTRIAPSLLQHATAGAGCLWLIQPRRIAARAAAARIAAELGEPLGGRIGYQVRFDNQLSAQTRLIAMTPGIALRRLQTDSVLSDVSAVLLDEFHERSLEMDLLLGMLRRLQAELRGDDLRLVIMSATLDATGLGEQLGELPIVRATAPSFPVQLIYRRTYPAAARPGPRRTLSPMRNTMEQLPMTVLEAAQKHPGDLLVFLPGVGEIKQLARELAPAAARADWVLLELYGELPPAEQDRVLAPTPYRRVILATNIAETSLTIDGIRVVVDAGWARVARIDSSVGLNRLAVEPISQASAAQRAGRAGRTAPGVCYRLWDEVSHRGRAEYLDPEIHRIGLSGAILTLLCWGEDDPVHFPWLTPPAASALEQAFELLVQLGAITADRKQVTPLGRQMQSFPLDPRLARLVIEGARLGIPRGAAWAAAMLAERDPFDSRRNTGGVAGGSSAATCDVTLRVASLLPGPDRESRLQAAQQQLGPVRHHVLRTIEQASRQLIDQVVSGGESEVETEAQLQALLPRALLTAYPDRLAKRREGNAPRGLMVGGRGVKLAESSRVRYAELLLCIDADAGGAEATVRLATRIEPDWLPAEHLEQVETRFLNPTTGAVTTRRQTRWLDLPIQETPIATPLDQQTAEMLAKAAAERFDRLLPPKDKRLQSLVRRIRWLCAADPACSLPSLTEEQLAQQLQDWCAGLKSLDEVRELDWHAVIESLLDPAGRQALRQQAPESFALPSGRQVLLEYEPGRPPILAARIQEFFGLADTPRLANGRVPMLLHLLAPNQRCQQVTDDLASFWKNTYPMVRKELRGRYPKHAWPEDPSQRAPGPARG